jgi:hypothetical protein
VIYTIPPSCPAYSCRYCYVYDVTPDVVYCGYLPGYVGCYHYDGVVVYGTGFYYQPWIGHVYYPRPFTYGFDAHYDVYHNHWGFSVGLAFGGGDAWVGYRDANYHHDDWFGHGGYRPAVVREDRSVNIYRTNITNVTINNNHTDVYRSQYNVYDRRKDVRYDVNARPELRTPARGAEARAEPARVADHTDHVAEERAVDTRNNVYTDSNGNVYRKTLDGWEKRDHNQWTPETPAHEEPSHAAGAPRETEDRHVAEKPDESPKEAPHESSADRAPEKSRSEDPDLNRDFRARVEGEERSRKEPADSHDDSHSDASPHDSGSSVDSRGGGGSGGSSSSSNSKDKH